MFTNFPEIDTPALLIEKSIMERNIKEMQALARKNGIRLRSHIKTHKIPVLAHMQIAAGACGIACAKIGEAEIMADAGINDIQIANIIVGDLKIERLLKLSERNIKISCCIDSFEGAKALSDKYSSQSRILDVYIKINSGFDRCGLNNIHDIFKLATFINSLAGLNLIGILTHAGQVYAAKDIIEVKEIGIHEGQFMVDITNKLRKEGINIKEISVGSTPAARYSSSVHGITELRAGNYIFHDMIQVSLGTCEIAQCALSVLATVISKPADNRVIIDAGSKSLGLDKGALGNVTTNGYGFITNKQGTIERLSEEHGITLHQNEKYEIGERLRIIPNHACNVVNLYDFAYLVDRDKIVDILKIEARGKIT
jgi:D-serine deaminase-like pyridoxal phosphate-dependent protein